MNKERLEWIVSGLNQYKLTKNEDLFVKSTVENFNHNQALTGHQEERIETLYREKSRLKPNKQSPDYFSFKEPGPKKTGARKPRTNPVR